MIRSHALVPTAVLAVLPVGLSVFLMTGCSLLCSTSGEEQLCGPEGECLSGDVCNSATNRCEKAPPQDAGPSNCAVETQDVDCPAGACVGGVCDDQVVAWNSGNPEKVDATCFGIYPLISQLDAIDAGNGAPDAGADAGGATGGPYPLDGCVTTFAGDSLVGAPAVALVADGGKAGEQATIFSSASCGSEGGYAYLFGAGDAGPSGVPVGRLFALDTAVDGGPTVRNYPIYLSAADVAYGSQRSAFTISQMRLASLLSQMGVTSSLDGGAGTTVVGVVNDCMLSSSGNQLSGVQVFPDRPQPVSYLNAEGVPVPGRTATDPGGQFAVYFPPGTPQPIHVAFAAVGPDGGASTRPSGFGSDGGIISLSLAGPGVFWVPLSPAGP